MSIAVAAAVGVAVGIVVGTLGAGGGILTVPILVYGLGFAPHSAAAASLVIVGATSLIALIPHARRGNVDWSRGLTFGLLGAVGALGGARLAARVDPALLMALFAGLLVLVAAFMARRSMLMRRRRGDSGEEEPGAERPRSRTGAVPLLVLLATLVGLLTGFFGVGGGFAVVPVLVLAMGVGMRRAVGTSLLVIVLNSATGILGRVGAELSVDWDVVAVFAVGSVLGGLLGARFSTRAHPATLTLLFAALLGLVALATAVQAVPDLLG